MLKLVGKIAFCFVLLLVKAFAQEREEQILFLHLERDANGVKLLRSTSVPGKVKEGVRRGALEYDVVNEAGEVVYRGGCPNPGRERIEYADAIEPGRLRSMLVAREKAEFIVRVPGAGAKRIRFFERASEMDRIQALSDRRLVSEMGISAPIADDRLAAASANAKLSMVLSNGPPVVRVNIVFLAEGYTAAQEANFTNQAKTVLNQMMSVSPYKEYRSHFNAFAIFVPSVEAGSDHPTRSQYRNTYFNSSYGEGALERLITIPPNNWNSNFSDGRGKVFALLSQFVPEYDIPLLLVNDTEYGGSGGVPAIASANALSGELALHEIGHSFAGLADEYEEELTGYPEVEYLNTTRETRRELIKWRAWIPDTVPVPTPETALYQNTVGLFEGAYFHRTGWYRPKLDCRMRNLSQPFCEVCRETHVVTIYSLVEPIQSWRPIGNNVTVPGGGELELKVDTIESLQQSLGYTWTVDGVTNLNFTSNTFGASFATIGTGSHLVRANVWDPTPFVRNDPRGALSQSKSWLVTVVAPTNVPPTISAIPDVVLELPQDSSGSAGFVVSDPDTPWYELDFRLRSSNTNLLGEGSLILAGGEFSRAVQIHPVPGKTGVSEVTVWVSDGTTEVEQRFDVIVADNDSDLALAPIENQRVFSGPLDISLSISRTSTNALQFSGSSSNAEVIADSGITFRSVGGEWRAELRPTLGAVGATTITISVSDGTEIAARSLVVEFLARPAVISNEARMTGEGVAVEFKTDISATMILEFSTDLVFWTTVSSRAGSTSLEYVAPDSRVNLAGFYRLRMVPL